MATSATAAAAAGPNRRHGSSPASVHSSLSSSSERATLSKEGNTNPVSQKRLATEIQSAHHELSSVLGKTPLQHAQLALDQTRIQLERAKLRLKDVHGDLDCTLKNQKNILDRIASAAEFLPKVYSTSSITKPSGKDESSTKVLPISATGSFSK